MPVLGEDGRVYVNAVIDYYSNSNSSSYSVDTFKFNNLSFHDPGSGIISGIYYRLLAQYNLGDSAYFSPGLCSFGNTQDTCLNREGVSDCIVTALGDVRAENYVSIYPNPVSTTLFIQFFNLNLAYNSRIKIFDLNGMVRRDIIAAGIVNRIDLTGLQSGVYILKITLRNSHSFNSKIMILK